MVENPLAANLMTLTQFLGHCSASPHIVNDIVFTGTFANFEDYQVFSTIINNLPNIRRFAIVNAQPYSLQINPAKLHSVTDIAIRSCRITQLPANLILGSGQLCSLDLSDNYLSDNYALESIRGGFHLEMLKLRGNRFMSVPKAVSSMYNLLHLDIGNNRVASLDGSDFSLMARLRTLDISYNEDITVLPFEVVHLPSLTQLVVTGLISLRRPRYTLAKNGLDTIKKYFIDKSKRGWLSSAKETTNIATWS